MGYLRGAAFYLLFFQRGRELLLKMHMNVDELIALRLCKKPIMDIALDIVMYIYGM